MSDKELSDFSKDLMVFSKVKEKVRLCQTNVEKNDKKQCFEGQIFHSISAVAYTILANELIDDSEMKKELIDMSKPMYNFVQTHLPTISTKSNHTAQPDNQSGSSKNFLEPDKPDLTFKDVFLNENISEDLRNGLDGMSYFISNH